MIQSLFKDYINVKKKEIQNTVMNLTHFIFAQQLDRCHRSGGHDNMIYGNMNELYCDFIDRHDKVNF